MPGNETSADQALVYPDWVPDAAQNYLDHTEGGHSIRAIARARGCHPSTILRQVRRFENRRDDPLVDEALRQFSLDYPRPKKPTPAKEPAAMTAHFDPVAKLPDETIVEREGRRILRRLSETGAVLAVASNMEKAVVVRETPDGRTIRTGVVDRAVAQAMALKDWISCQTDGRITRYRITQAGRAALARLLANDPTTHHGFAEAPAEFGDQHRVWGEKQVQEAPGERPKRMRYNVAESPVAALARRKEKDGTRFLSDELVAAGERLREDFELAQMGPRVTQNWEKFLTGSDRGGYNPSATGQTGPDGARARVSAALKDLGPGLGDVVLRCCCFLEGMETAERQMGWSARSGKIVLRIALQRLKRHYDENAGTYTSMIG